MTRTILLRELRSNVERAVCNGDLPEPRDAKHTRAVGVEGPRAGILRVDFGMDNADLLRSLRSDSRARLRQLFPQHWIENSAPSVYPSGRDICLECAWPAALQTNTVHLSEIGNRPHTPGAFVLGMSQYSETVTVKFDQRVIQNGLYAGMPGSGKTTSLISTLAQLARNEPAAQFVICDGKGDLMHSGMGTLNGLIGPLATSRGEMVAAMNWMYSEMERRNHDGGQYNPIFWIWDEPEEILMNDPECAKKFFFVLKKGRSANIHTIIAMQSPKQDSFGNPMSRAQIGFSLCHLVRNRHESEAAIGDTEPRADHLTACGDAYAIAPLLNERVLMAMVDRRILDAVLGHTPMVFDAWPVEYDDLEPTFCPTPEQAAAALYAAQHKMNRQQFRALGVGFENSQYSELKAYGQQAATFYDGLGGPSVDLDV